MRLLLSGLAFMVSLSVHANVEENLVKIISVQQAQMAQLERRITRMEDSLVGTISAFVGNEIPEGWLRCDGKEIDKAKYAKLYERIGDTWSNFNGQVPPASHQFRVPSLKNLYLRGDYIAGKFRLNTTASNGLKDEGHTHAIDWYGKVYTDRRGGTVRPDVLVTSTADGGYNPMAMTGYAKLVGDSETAPNSATVIYIIRY